MFMHCQSPSPFAPVAMPAPEAARTRVHPARVTALGALFAALLATSLSGPPLAAQQPVDEEYTALIREATTEEFFSTPLVDHLPFSETVPTPLDHLGHIAGAPDVLSYPEEVYSYMRALAAASPRVEVFTIGESEEGREMILVVVGSEESIAELEANKAALRALADPRITTPEAVEEIIASTKPMYWSAGAIHSPETGSPEMFMELAYRLAVGESDFIREIRDGVIYMITPIIEVDGRAKVVDLHMGKRKDPDANLPTRPLYWGKYVAHDNNRDNIGQALALSRAVTGTYLEYRPTVFHDHHESASHLYTSTGRGPYNAWLDPIVINEWNRLAYKEVQDMTAFGVPGVYTHDFYDGWGANYMMWVAHMRNSIGRFYETQGAGDASTRIIRSDVERQWHRPSTPLSEVVWGIRNNVNLQQSAVLIAMHEVATNGEEFLRNFYAKSERSVAKAHNEGPAAYVLPADDPRPGQQARLLQLMEDHGFEVHRADDEIEIGETVFPEDSYVVRMDQPFSRGADMLLDKQYYNPDDPRPYDDVGWTVGPLFNAQTVRVEDSEMLDADMTLVESVPLAGGVEGGRGGTYLDQLQRRQHAGGLPFRARRSRHPRGRGFIHRRRPRVQRRHLRDPRGRPSGDGSRHGSQPGRRRVRLHGVSHSLGARRTPARDTRPPHRRAPHLDEHPGRRLAASRDWTSTGSPTTTSRCTTCGTTRACATHTT